MGVTPAGILFEDIMRNFYTILAVLSGAYLTVQLAVYLFFGRRLFPNTGELFEHRTRRADWQTVFPKNLLRLIVFILMTSLIGLIVDNMGMPGWISLPCGAVGGLAFNFLLTTVFSPLYYRLNKKGAPKPQALENTEGTVTEEITPELYGTIRVESGGRPYYFSAVSANGRTLPAGTKAIVITCEDGLCFVESQEHFFDVLFEEDSSETPTVSSPDNNDQSNGGTYA